MRIGKFFQDPNERKRYTIEYDVWLEDTEILTLVTYAIEPTTVPPLAVAGSAIAVGGRSVSFFVEGGLDDTNYKITVTATTDDGQIKEDHIQLNVRSQ